MILSTHSLHVPTKIEAAIAVVAFTVVVNIVVVVMVVVFMMATLFLNAFYMKQFYVQEFHSSAFKTSHSGPIRTTVMKHCRLTYVHITKQIPHCFILYNL